MLGKYFRFQSRKFTSILKNGNSSELEIDKWLASRFVVEKVIPIVGFSPYPLDELLLMVGAVCYFKPTHIFEWGTHIGKSARIFYETINAFDVEAEIFSFDLPDDLEHIEHPGSSRGKLVKGLEGVYLYQEDALVRSFEIYNKSAILDKKAFFYIDGDHSFDTVLKELRTVFRMVPEAVVLLHDTFYQSSDANYNIGPFLAIEQFLKESEYSFSRVDTKIGLPGMTLLYKNKKGVR
jgi:cephalosporin hydroxylase